MIRLTILALFFISCADKAPDTSQSVQPTTDTMLMVDSVQTMDVTGERITIKTGNVTPAELLNFAQSQMGVPYKYGSIDPAAGFDCSGFITYVFNHFNIQVPRSSVDFTNVERTVDVSQAKPGDLVLFTGTDSTIRVVGHMGIINSVEAGEISFIHSSSGKANGVTITPLNDYYKGRFVKVLRIFRQND